MTEIVTLKALCDELKLNPRKARQRLRAASVSGEHQQLIEGRKSKDAWQWVAGSTELDEARRVLAS
ncbi:hypothetical protein [Neotabrizicola sp. sgz301269]|uniref:hypothetical protein n=1 Tax=Neotabrizicola sp. sgz301269 TaxID=3276282 RepID=UPI0037705D3A